MIYLLTEETTVVIVNNNNPSATIKDRMTKLTHLLVYAGRCIGHNVNNKTLLIICRIFLGAIFFHIIHRF